MMPTKPEPSISQRAYLLVGTVALLTGSLTAASAQSAVPGPHLSAPVQTVAFKGGTSSSGWIDFTPYTNFGIHLPVKINGHDAAALLYGGPSTIDTNFVASLGLTPRMGAAGSVRGITVQTADLTLQNATAAQDDLQKQGYDARILGHPVLVRLGEEVFNQVAVDIDFSHHQVTFRDQANVIKPAGAFEIPLVELDSECVLPLSVNGAAPMQFELELGNVIGPLMVTPAYAEKEDLVQDRPHSQRLSGRFVETVVSVDHLGFAGIDLPKTPIALIPDSEVPPASIAGGFGLPLLARFRLIIDYSHNRLYAIPDDAAVKKPIEKDRIGLVFDRKSTDILAVAFVAPNSPAEAAGFKKGEKVAITDGKTIAEWPSQAIIAFQVADAGTIRTFKMLDGTVRQIKAQDSFEDRSLFLSALANCRAVRSHNFVEQYCELDHGTE